MKYLKLFESYDKKIIDLDNSYDYFHISWDRFNINNDGKTFTFTPRVPETPYGYESGTIEDDFTKRVSLSDSIINCLYALPESGGDDYYYIYGYKGDDSNIIDTRETFKKCPPSYGKDFNLNKWISSLPLESQKEIKMNIHGLEIVNISDLPTKYKDMFYGCVPDANDNVEYWSLKPITMDYLGAINPYEYEDLNIYDPKDLNNIVPQKRYE